MRHKRSKLIQTTKITQTYYITLRYAVIIVTYISWTLYVLMVFTTNACQRYWSLVTLLSSDSLIYIFVIVFTTIFAI